ncbi:MAG: DUF1772 domain-containing protein [Maritimibacter sp.]
MNTFLRPMALLSLLLSGGIFGFFYAWICSTMWGLDAIDPRIAIAAMNGMNDSVRNAVFAPAFFGTPIALFLTAWLASKAEAKSAARTFLIAALIYLFGGIILTASINVPMNRALLDVVIPEDIDAAQRIWNDYSPRWQRFNALRTLFSGLALLLTGYGLTVLHTRKAD